MNPILKPGPNRRLKLVYVLKMFPRLSETFILNEILALEEMGHEVTVFSRLRHDEPLTHESFAGVRGRVHYVAENDPRFLERVQASHQSLVAGQPRRYFRTAAHARGRNHTGAWVKFLQAGIVADAARRIGADQIHAHFLTGNSRVAEWAGALSGIPYSVTAHAKDIYANPADERTLVRRMRRARFVVTISDYNLRHLGKMLGDPGKIVRLYNGVDLRRFRPPANRHVDPGAPPLLAAVGRLVPKKGFEVLVEACRILKRRGVGFRCEIIGRGDGEGGLRRRIAAGDLQDRVILRGPMTHDRLREEVYPRTGLAVLPCVVTSDGDRDGIPTVLIEALAMGIPVVSTRVSGIPELVESGRCGSLVEPGDPAAFAGAVEALLRSPGRRAAFALRGRRRVEREFDLQANVARLAEMFARDPAPAMAGPGPTRRRGRVVPFPGTRPRWARE